MSTTLAPQPVHGSYPPNSDTFISTFNATSNLKNNHAVDHGRDISRTPSPTPEEYNLLHGIKPVRTTKQKITTYAIVAVLAGLGITLALETKNIVHALKPATDWLHDQTFGPLIPIAILIIISFPPLFGHELVAMMVGVTWDLPTAFVIVAIGTVLGEVANFFTFKYACSARGAKLEVKNLDYGLLAYVVRNGSFWVILIIRYSAIPPHFATTVFSTVGIAFWIFLAAAILSLPKQLVPVYIGYVMQPSVKDDGTSKIVEYVVLGLGVVTTIAAYAWITRKIKAATPDFIYGRRKVRQDGGEAPSHYIDVSFPAEA
ncbi:hypothetical protein DFH08DRAFT_492933 [Mycena albidolilacea]|uniref:Golgi apparatus membrane protein TVP38 n=1 Tax=Mycena albidolilacea TaxID=1033008 RepID=A0AAD6Z4L0_9AGAR|nr:hypothetical protein DFH08DRAFT_492933 [Mycena albidolilacea]